MKVNYVQKYSKSIRVGKIFLFKGLVNISHDTNDWILPVKLGFWVKHNGNNIMVFIGTILPFNKTKINISSSSSTTTNLKFIWPHLTWPGPQKLLLLQSSHYSPWSIILNIFPPSHLNWQVVELALVVTVSVTHSLRFTFNLHQ